jgi:hypothetical protein
MSKWRTAAVLAGYSAISFLYFGVRIARHAGRDYAGNGADPQIFVWMFGWWPHALLHGENPLVTHAIWAPDGVNLAWVTSVPALAIVLMPVTLAFGPVVSYNVAAVLLPALAAVTALVLCRHVTGTFWPSVLGGYLFGFSGYMLGQQQGHFHMTSVFLLPLVALVVLRFVERSLSSRGLVLRLGPLLAAQILLSTEVFFTASVALVAGVVLAFAVAPAARTRLRALLAPGAAAFALATLLAAPLLAYALTGFETESINRPASYPGDLLNFVVPTRLVAVGGGNGLAPRFPGNISEQGAYLGLPTLVIVGWYARLRWRTPGGRFLLAGFALAAVAALGTALYVGGHAIGGLPYTVLKELPGFSNVLPVRLVVYGTLAAAVMAASWAAVAAVPLALRVLLPVVAVASLLPDVGSNRWATHPRRLAFFTDGAARRCLPAHGNIVILPYAGAGNGMLWQAEDGFRFRQAGGYVRPAPPDSFLRWPAAEAFNLGKVPSPVQVQAFVRAKDVEAFVVDDAAAGGRWRPSLDPLAAPAAIGGALVYGGPCGARLVRAAK